MTLSQLENKLIEYYKKHSSEFVQITTMGYIDGNYPNKSYGKLHLAILKSHPHSWGFPDVSAIETAAERFMKADGVELKIKRETREYRTQIEPLTDEELIQAEESGARDKWKYLLKNNTDISTDKIDPEKLQEVKEELKG